MPKVICLHGPVGCGKTTLLNELKQRVPNSYVVPEYIDALDDAKDKRQQYLDGYERGYDEGFIDGRADRTGS